MYAVEIIEDLEPDSPIAGAFNVAGGPTPAATTVPAP